MPGATAALIAKMKAVYMLSLVKESSSILLMQWAGASNTKASLANLAKKLETGMLS